jgi:hypothetical protein
MSFVTTQPEALTSAATALGGIGSGFSAQNAAAAAAPTTGWFPPQPADLRVSPLFGWRRASFAEDGSRTCPVGGVVAFRRRGLGRRSRRAARRLLDQGFDALPGGL